MGIAGQHEEASLETTNGAIDPSKQMILLPLGQWYSFPYSFSKWDVHILGDL